QQPAPLSGPAETPAPPPAPYRRSRVLLVEDDHAVRDATRLLLKVEGYEVFGVASLAEALQKTREIGRVDLLITDYHLRDGETGTQVIATLRETLPAPLKAVLITGDTSTSIKQLSCDPHLRLASKPIKAEELLQILKVLLAV
ncbi:MAG TPA: response regulator, partial [Steroidobacteraceae bacterium]